jgi:hypothetical protein
MAIFPQERMKAINERRFQKIEEEVLEMTDDILENLKNMASRVLTTRSLTVLCTNLI